MRIGVDASCWANGRGYGRFTRELLTAMVQLTSRDEFICFADAGAADQVERDLPGVRVQRIAQDVAPTEAAAADGYRSPRDMLRLTHAVWRARPDVFFCPSVYTYFPLPPGVPAVVTLHDAIAERFPELTLPSPRARWFWRAKVRLAVWQARLILTVSDFSARDLVRTLGIAPGRIRITCEAPSPTYRPSDARESVAEVAARVGLPPGARWFTYVGGFNPHKHVDLIVRAHARLVEQLGAVAPHLVLAGTTDGDVFHGNLDTIRGAIREAGTESRVHWPGFVPDDDLRHLHSGAVALLLPSACEGFGLPAVEAAACETAVIATTESPLPELLSGGGIFLQPGDQAALFAAMRTLSCDEPHRAALAAEARHRASQLTWAAGARAALDTLYEAAA